ncbi:MAG: TIGR02757 family protein [Holophagaceae bacterium]|nr:TIGR02757 family protein [Holophagaceae bacterium]
MKTNNNIGLKKALDVLCDQYKSCEALEADPISIPLGYKNAIDKEFSSWVAAHLAYGRVAPMIRAIRHFMEPFGSEPVAWVRGRTEQIICKEICLLLNGWVWRFHTLEDMANWILAWKRMDEATGNRGIESLLLPCKGMTADQSLSVLVQTLRQSLPKTSGIRFNLPDPIKGAASKRWRLFLRWMVRKGWPDFGIWEKYPPSELIIPLDTHVHRISKQVGLCTRSSPDAKAARQITEALKIFDPTDPLKYDFAIAHLGILRDCNGKRRKTCKECSLFALCQTR